MITIYHGMRPNLPLAACSRHLGRPVRADGWVWRENPLWVAGSDDGGMVCCLVHGRHQSLYRRALAGTGEIFGIATSWVNTDQLVWQTFPCKLSIYCTLLLFDVLPEKIGCYFRPTVDNLIDKWLYHEQEGRR
ncbi:MAG: hypothetical protein P4N59_21045 [Negativicutes bacterium]|nr:hypothetical protein [Negativicutes bacterium]